MITVPSPRHTTLAHAAEAIVRQHIGDPGHAQIVITNAHDAATRATQAEAALLPEMSDHARKTLAKKTYKAVRRHAGLTLPGTAPGASLILINTDCTPDEFLPQTLVHELVHAVQLAHPHAHAAHLRHMRHESGITRMPWSAHRRYLRVIRDHEREAYAAEHLAAHITH